MKLEEVEKLTGLKEEEMLFYETNGVFQSGNDHNNKEREYSEEEIELLMQIKVLRYLGFCFIEIKELITASPKSLKEALENKEQEYQRTMEDCNMQKRICKILKNGCKKNKDIRDIIKENKKLIPNLDETIDTIKELSHPSMLEMVSFSIICLGPIIWLFINMAEEKWSAFGYNIPLALIATILLTLKWSSYFRKYKKIR